MGFGRVRLRKRLGQPGKTVTPAGTGRGPDGACACPFTVVGTASTACGVNCTSWPRDGQGRVQPRPVCNNRNAWMTDGYARLPGPASAVGWNAPSAGRTCNGTRARTTRPCAGTRRSDPHLHDRTHAVPPLPILLDASRHWDVAGIHQWMPECRAPGPGPLAAAPRARVWRT